MTQPLIVLGDTTSHGGRVISASPFSDTGGIPIARVGDMVSCRRCKGVYPIVQGDPSWIVDGQPVAYHGCKTACGASLIGGQTLTHTLPSGGGAPQLAGLLTDAFADIGNNLAASYQNELIDEVQQRFRGRFQVVDASTGEPIREMAARVRSTAGKYLSVVTDEEGFTEWVEHENAEALAFDYKDSW